MEPSDSPTMIQSVERACQILFSFSLERPRWRTSDLSQALGLHHSTTSRLLTTMRKMGLLKKDPITQEYELSLRVLQLARTVLSQLDLIKIAMPLLSSLVEKCRESAFLVILDGVETVTVAQIAAPRVLSPSPYHVGRRYQASAVSGGKLLLAYGPQSLVDQLIDEGLVAYTEHTITSPQRLSEELDQVRRQGYAISNQELEVGLLAIAAPIWDRSGVAVAAISLSGPPDRLGKEQLPGLVSQVRDTADQISRALGWPGSDDRSSWQF